MSGSLRGDGQEVEASLSPRDLEREELGLLSVVAGFPRVSVPRERAYPASACITLAKVPLAKASHMARRRVRVRGD